MEIEELADCYATEELARTCGCSRCALGSRHCSCWAYSEDTQNHLKSRKILTTSNGARSPAAVEQFS
ncbi:hypothetical protein EVAR_72498_1 [Eumeta japonica]|uniref:Uncharacterized protein n=1 Tax=Eumeta variegata TaxID=151549 RepID=A0A4C1TA03_EUMVA|nr:hypothetical protein EVAR_72498_1 [Eumeta japonica]